jgi:hypothetical protein
VKGMESDVASRKLQHDSPPSMSIKDQVIVGPSK